MKYSGIAIMVMLIAAPWAIAQQDPLDPGHQDSLIIGSAHVDSGASFVFIHVYAVTDDSIAYYNIPLRWITTGGGVYPTEYTQYFWPITYWRDHIDTVFIDRGYMLQYGFADDVLYVFLFTNELRINVWNLIFTIAPGAPSQLVRLDTTWDNRNGSIRFGAYDGEHEFAPAFVPGYISIGSVGLDDNLIPAAFSLFSNYPNPFNSSTTIDFIMPQSGIVSLIIYDLLGNEVRKLVKKTLEAGDYSVTWDARDNANIEAASGVYIYRLTSSFNTTTKKMTLLR
jgi:hypothetical protein